MKKITALTISVLLILSMCLNVYSNNEVTEIDNTVTNIDNTEESDTIKLEETEGIDNVISSTDSKISTDNSSSANEEETTEIKPEENSKSVENDTTASADEESKTTFNDTGNEESDAKENNQNDRTLEFVNETVPFIRPDSTPYERDETQLVNGLTEEEFEKILRDAEEENRIQQNMETIEKITQQISLSSDTKAQISYTSPVVEGSVTLYSENIGYNEYFDDNTTDIQFVLKNVTSQPVMYSPIIVEYDGFGRLIEPIILNTVVVGQYSLHTLTALNYVFPENCSYIKLLMIDLETMKPYAHAKAFYQKSDMYGGTPQSANIISDTSKPVRGHLEQDVDIFEFCLQPAGNYKFECTATNTDPYLGLCDYSGNILAAMKTKSIKTGYIPAGEYYLYVHSYEPTDYVITVTNLDTGSTIPVVTPKAREDASFIYVNHPEYITHYDIVDQAPYNDETKIFEQKDVTGKNTFYETHLAWWGNGNYPTSDFYIDVDFYNPSQEPVTINITNLAYGTMFENSAFYIGPNNLDFTITVGGGDHYLLFRDSAETFYESLLCPEPGKNNEGNYLDCARIAILFDFEVANNKSVTVSSIAASNEVYLNLEDENRFGPYGKEIKSGDVITNFDNRKNEHDIHHKAKGIARNQGSWIDTELTFEFTDSTANGILPVYYQDEQYPAGVKGPGDIWVSHISPIFDEYVAFKYSMPNNLHKFVYTNSDGKRFNFDLFHKNLLNLDQTGVNAKISDNILNDLKRSAETGIKAPSLPYEGSLNPYLSLGEWGTAYNYKVTFRNNGTVARRATVKITGFDEMLIGFRFNENDEYTTGYYRNKWATNNAWVNDITSVILPGEEVTFDIVTLCCVGNVGTTYKAELSNV